MFCLDKDGKRPWHIAFATWDTEEGTRAVWVSSRIVKWRSPWLDKIPNKPHYIRRFESSGKIYEEDLILIVEGLLGSNTLESIADEYDHPEVFGRGEGMLLPGSLDHLRGHFSGFSRHAASWGEVLPNGLRTLGCVGFYSIGAAYLPVNWADSRSSWVDWQHLWHGGQDSEEKALRIFNDTVEKLRMNK